MEAAKYASKLLPLLQKGGKIARLQIVRKQANMKERNQGVKL